MKLSLLLSMAAFASGAENYYATHDGGSQYVGNQNSGNNQQGQADGNAQNQQGNQNQGQYQYNQQAQQGQQQQQSYQQWKQNGGNGNYNGNANGNQADEDYQMRQNYNQAMGGQYVNGEWVYNYNYDQGAYDAYDPERYYTGYSANGDNNYEGDGEYNGPYQYYGNYDHYNKQDQNYLNYQGGEYYDEDGNVVDAEGMYNGGGHHYYSGYYGNPSQNENPDDYTGYQSKCDGSANSRYCNNQGKDMMLGYVDVNNCANTIIQVQSAQVTCDSPYQYYYGNGAKRNSYLCDHGDQASITVFFKVLKDLPADQSVFMTMGLYANVAGTYELTWSDKAANVENYVGHSISKKGKYAFSTRVKMDDDNNVYNENGEFIPVLEMGFSTKQDKLYNLGGMNIECTWDNTYQPYSPNPWWAGGKGGSFIKASRDTVGSKVAAFFLNLIILIVFLSVIGGICVVVYRKYGDKLGLSNIEFQGTLDKAADFFRMGDDDEEQPGIDHSMTDTSKSLAA